jgi:hypothetical protein
LNNYTTVIFSDQRWKNIVGDFQIPSQFKRVKYVFLYINGPSANTDILIDDSKLTVLPKDENWKKKADSMIEKIRKRDVTIKYEIFSRNILQPIFLVTTLTLWRVGTLRACLNVLMLSQYFRCLARHNNQSCRNAGHNFFEVYM